MNLPYVSIPITSYNQANFIQETVLSAVEQDYDNLHVTVYDDGSTDVSREILVELERKYPGRLNLHFNKTNLGGGRNRWQSLLLSRGDFITYLDGDDIFLPGKIRKQVEFMQERQEFDISYHNVEVFDSKTNKPIYYWKDRFGFGSGDTKKMIRFGNYLCTLSVMFRKDRLQNLEYYGDIRIGQDWIILLQILMNGHGKYGYIDEVLARHRRHAENRTLLWDEKIESNLATLEIVGKKYPQFSTQIRERKSDVHLSKAAFLFASNKYKQALNVLLKSVQLAFPRVWNLLRLPVRELIFVIRSNGRVDELLRSLLIKS